METTIYDFHTIFYIPAIQSLGFQLPHVRILSKNHCSELRRTSFKYRKLFQDIICRCDYDEGVVATFAHKIQSEYFSGNRSVSIEGISLENFSALPKADINSNTQSRQRHAVFNYFLYDERKQDSATTTEHSKSLIALLEDKKYH